MLLIPTYVVVADVCDVSKYKTTLVFESYNLAWDRNLLLTVLINKMLFTCCEWLIIIKQQVKIKCPFIAA